MQPPDARDDVGLPDRPSRRAGVLRRYGPITAIGAALAIIAGVSVATMDEADDEDDDEAGVATTGDLPEGAITWSMAQEQELDVAFPDTCDTDSGMVAIPFFFRTQCFANVEDNGGSTAEGVTGEEIEVVAWIPDNADSVLAVAKGAFGSDASAADVRATYEGLVEIFQDYYQTYGRTVRLSFAEASGDTLNAVVARSDAVAAAEQGPFAALGGPLITPSWTEELHARDIVCVACPGIPDPEPTAFSITPSQRQVSEHIANYIGAKLAGRPAEFAGGDLSEQDRVIGILKLGQNPSDEVDVAFLQDLLADEGIEVATTFSYPLDLGGGQELATSFVSQFKEAGVTTVIAQGDPILLADMTDEATRQDWFPEWVLPGTPFVDTNAFARNYDQQQWANAFGLSYLPPAARPELSPAYQLYEWYHGEPPPAAELLFLIYPQVALFFTGVSYAGPNLTPETFRDGLFAFPPTPRAVTQPSVDYGTGLWDPEIHDEDDYDGIDDMVELWWDPDAVVVDEAGVEAQGGYQYVDGGRRYYADDYTDELKMFDPAGAVGEITEPPPEEVPPDYPPPR